ncbi:hypothetical protein DIPPA_26906 [Diplonema papillatum]|nr:hypothetical protein DIPPA_26906 [Diplonema papillatum]
MFESSAEEGSRPPMFYGASGNLAGLGRTLDTWQLRTATKMRDLEYFFSGGPTRVVAGPHLALLKLVPNSFMPTDSFGSGKPLGEIEAERRRDIRQKLAHISRVFAEDQDAGEASQAPERGLPASEMKCVQPPPDACVPDCRHQTPSCVAAAASAVDSASPSRCSSAATRPANASGMPPTHRRPKTPSVASAGSQTHDHRPARQRPQSAGLSVEGRQPRGPVLLKRSSWMPLEASLPSVVTEQPESERLGSEPSLCLEGSSIGVSSTPSTTSRPSNRSVPSSRFIKIVPAEPKSTCCSSSPCQRRPSAEGMLRTCPRDIPRPLSACGASSASFSSLSTSLPASRSGTRRCKSGAARGVAVNGTATAVSGAAPASGSSGSRASSLKKQLRALDESLQLEAAHRQKIAAELRDTRTSLAIINQVLSKSMRQKTL